MNTKCLFGIHNWEPIKDYGSPRRRCTRCKKRQVYIKFTRYTGKWLRN